MDLASLGFNIPAIVAIGALSEYIKKWDKHSKFKRFNVLVPAILSFAVALGLSVQAHDYSTLLNNTLMLFGGSSFGYSLIKKTLKKSEKAEETKTIDG